MKKIVPVFDPIGIGRTLVVRAANVGHVLIFVTAYSCFIVVLYLTSVKK